MGSGKNSIFLIIFVSLIAATAVNAAPIITYCDNFTSASPSPNTRTLDISKTNKINKLYNTTLAAIGTEYLLPPAELTNSPSAGAGTFHPNAIVFIVLIGFLFVSLAIDRTFWLATLTAPLRTGQSGFHSIPQLAGIPAEKITFPYHISMHDKIRQKYNIQHAIHITNAVLKFTIKHFSSLHKPALIWMALSYEQNQSFSPAFIFVRMARVPPILV